MVVDTIPCFIMNLNTNTKVVFSVEIPEEVSDSYTANADEQTVKGRSSPFMAYSSSGPRNINFAVKIALDYRRDLVNVIEELRMMLKPYKTTVVEGPLCLVRIGDILNIKAFPTAFDVVWSDGYKENVYRIATCSFSFNVVEDNGTFSNTSKGSEESSTSASKSKSSASRSSTKEEKKTNVEKKTTKSSTKYKVGEKYYLKKDTKGYYTAMEAYHGKSTGNPTAVYKKGSYWIYKKSNGMINITKSKGTPGAWINPK